jgi:protein-S-isoprenylcysteine O-methyltransferase Ste14
VKPLHARAWGALFALTLVLGILLFAAAATVRYWQGWTYLALFFATSSLTTLYLMKKDPTLLARRMRGGPTAEKERTQQIIMLFTSVSPLRMVGGPHLGRAVRRLDGCGRLLHRVRGV